MEEILVVAMEMPFRLELQSLNGRIGETLIGTGWKELAFSNQTILGK